MYSPQTAAHSDAVLTLPGHAHNPVHVVFQQQQQQGYKLVTVGKHDGLMFTWNIEA